MNRTCLSILCCLLCFFPVASWAQEAYQARTTADPTLAISDLESLVRPLRVSELQVEADAWLRLLQNKVEAISQAEISVKAAGRAASATSREAAPAADQLLAAITQLRSEQTALIDRFEIVTAALKLKGGEINEYEKYVAAVSGMRLDATDIGGTSTLVMGWLRSPEGGIRWGKRIAAFIVIMVLAKILSGVLGSLTRKAVDLNEKASDLLRNFLVGIVHQAVMIIGLVVAVGQFGVDIGPLIAGIGAVGFILGFALQGTLGNLAAGIMILLYRPYDVGDVVTTAGVSGSVKHMNLNTTTITTFDNKLVVVPNGKIWGDTIVNATGSATRRVDMVFGIGYGDDIAKAVGILEALVQAHPLVLDDPKPTIKVNELGDSSVNFICRPWSKTGDYWSVYWDITRSVKERFDAEGVTIPFPQRDVHVYNGSPEPVESSSGAAM